MWIFDEDMNIDCIANHVKIDPTCIRNISKYTLGTQKFRDSVSTVEIQYIFTWN